MEITTDSFDPFKEVWSHRNAFILFTVFIPVGFIHLCNIYNNRFSFEGMWREKRQNLVDFKGYVAL